MGTGGPSALVSPTHPPAYADELLYVSIDLSSRFVAKQVFSALQSLTSVFGMGTGGPSALVTLTCKTFLPFRVLGQDQEPQFLWCTFGDSNPGPTD